MTYESNKRREDKVKLMYLEQAMYEESEDHQGSDGIVHTRYKEEET
jgi:hypothetical protein